MKTPHVKGEGRRQKGEIPFPFARHLLRPSHPLAKPTATKRIEIAPPLDGYAP